MQMAPFSEAISEHVWHTRYQWSDDGRALEPSIEASWDRVALAVSSAETHHRQEWRERFRAILGDFRFLPSGRILAGAPRCSIASRRAPSRTRCPASSARCANPW